MSLTCYSYNSTLHKQCPLEKYTQGSPINKMAFPLYLRRRRWKGGTIVQAITISTAVKR